MKVVSSLVISASMLSSVASASVTLDWVTVGNAGNTADPLTGFGAVGYEYKIGKYEVTNAQYGAFLNAKGQSNSNGIYNSFMPNYGITQSGSSGSYTYSVTTSLANRPVVHVSWFDAARFANWLANGQGSGSTETGSYTLNGATSGIILANAGAQIYIPTENEWYKAAYYSAVSQTYSLYPNGQNTITTADANYGGSVGSSTDIGTYSDDPSSYGTFDQGGNVYEWNDAVMVFGTRRGMRGGGWPINGPQSTDPSLTSSSRYDNAPWGENEYIGFRLTSVLEPTIGTPSIPEPSALGLTMLASGMMLIRRRR